MESNGFDMSVQEKAIMERKKMKFNQHLTGVENEIYLAIKYGDSTKLKDLAEDVNLNFKIEIDKELFYYPIHLAAALGQPECTEILLKNKNVDIDQIDE